jgi:hypothetical protein
MGTAVAVDGHVLQTCEPEEHQRHVVPARSAVEALDVRHPRVLEQGDVEVRGLFRLGVEPQA